MYNNQEGDTMVEVMLGVVILSIVLAAAYTLGNRATRIGGDASEKTLIANQLQEQIERIKNAQSSGGANWGNITSNLYNTGPGRPDLTNCNSPSPSGSSKPFAIKDDLSIETLNFTNGFYTVWIEGYKDDPTSPTYADFYIRACWQGREGPVDKRADMFIRINL